MRHRSIFVSIIVFSYFFIWCVFRIRSTSRVSPLHINSLSINNTNRHTAIILATSPTVKVLKHLRALVNVGIDAFVMCDKQPSKKIDLPMRILYVNDESLAQYGFGRNRVWDRVFVWLYNQSSIDYVWLMEDDVTWSNIQHIVDLFNEYGNNKADLLSREIIPRNNQTLGWIWWPRMQLTLFPENKWSGTLNMLSRVSHRLIKAHQHYAQQLFNERQKNSSYEIDNKYYFQEFFIPTVANMFNLTILTYNYSNMQLHVSQLSEDDIGRSLANGKQIFHAVKHDSQLLINGTKY